MSLDDAITAARTHAANLRADIPNASSRIEHVRVTTLAVEAENLVRALESVECQD